MKQIVLTEIDALLDTRLGTLNLLDPSFPELVLIDPDKYRSRLSDEFSLFDPKINDEQYQVQYAARNIETLAASTLTETIVHLVDLAESFKIRFIKGDPNVTGMEFWINAWPYQLDQPMESEIVKCVAYYLKLDRALVKMVNIPYDELDHSFVRNNGISALMMYNYREWIEAAYTTEEPPEGDPSVTVLVPALVKSVAKTRETWLKYKDSNEEYLKDAFVASRLVMAAVFSVDFRPAEVFSIIDIDRLARSTRRGSPS